MAKIDDVKCGADICGKCSKFAVAGSHTILSRNSAGIFPPNLKKSVLVDIVDEALVRRSVAFEEFRQKV